MVTDKNSGIIYHTDIRLVKPDEDDPCRAEVLLNRDKFGKLLLQLCQEGADQQPEPMRIPVDIDDGKIAPYFTL